MTYRGQGIYLQGRSEYIVQPTTTGQNESRARRLYNLYTGDEPGGKQLMGRLGEVYASMALNDVQTTGKYIDYAQTFDGVYVFQNVTYLADVKTTVQRQYNGNRKFSPSKMLRKGSKQHALYWRGYPFALILNFINDQGGDERPATVVYIVNQPGDDHNKGSDPFVPEDTKAALDMFAEYDAEQILMYNGRLPRHTDSTYTPLRK